MKAILCTRFGGPDDLELKDLPDPVAGPGEVVVAVKAAALNFFDTLIIAGKYQLKPPFPFSPASEFAGVVESVGARSEEHTSELQSPCNLVCRLLLEKKKKIIQQLRYELQRS